MNSSVLACALWLTAAFACWGRLKLFPDEALMAGGLAVSLEAVTVMTVLGCLGRMTTGLVTGSTVFCCLLHLVLAYNRRGLLPRAGRKALPPPVLAALAAVAAAAAFRLYLACSLPIDSWDALTYHVPMIWRWVQQGSLDLAGWSGQQRYGPINGELIPAWLAVLDGGSLDAVRTAQSFGLVWLGCAGAVIGRRLGGLVWAWAAAAALLALPIALIQAGAAYVDVFYAAYWAAAVAAALGWNRTGKTAHLALWGLGFGLALGTKATIYFQAPLLLPLLAAILSRRERLPQLLRAAPWAAGLALAAGSFTYFRNLVQHGNPIYPFIFKAAGRTLFNGVLAPQELLVTVERWFVPSRAGWLSYPFHETMKGAIGFSSENGFGAVFAAGWALFPLAALRALSRRDWRAAGFLALLPATALFFLTLHPTREPRYVIFVPAIVIGALTYALSPLRGGARAAALWGWAFGVVWGLLGVLGYFGSDAGLASAWRTLRNGGKVEPLAYYRAQYASLGELWTALDARLKKDEVVAINYGELQQPLAGSPARGIVRIVSHSESDFPESLWGSSDGEWLAVLDRIRARYLVIWSPPWYDDVGKQERAAIAKFPARFGLLGRWQSQNMGTAELYDVLPPAPATETGK